MTASVFAAGCKPGDNDAASVVGVIGSLGLAPGAFHYPRAIACASDGKVFVADKTGRLQRFSADGAFETTWTMPQIEKGKPIGMVVHPDGRLFVADTHYNRVAVFDRDGRFLADFGSGDAEHERFSLTTDIAFDRDGRIYVGEYHERDRITQWSADLKFLASIGENPIDGERLRRPAGLAFDAEDVLWVADACNHRIVGFKTDGTVVRSFGGFGTEPGRMRYPYDLTVTKDGTLIVCEFEGARLQWFSREGRSLRTWGRHGRSVGELFAPWGLALGKGGNVYVVDSLNNRVQIVAP